MSKLGEALLLALNRLAPDSSQALLVAKADPLAYLELLRGKSASSFAIFGDLNLTGQEVLDVGCGLGTNLVHLCELGARRVTALDIGSLQIRRTKSMLANHYSHLASRLQFVAADAATMPLEDESFDVLISADTFEHVDNLPRVLQECSRVLRPGGYLYAYFPPFYAPWGAHMVNWIRLPWCQVLFAESTIVNAARRIERKGKSINDQLPPETRLDLQEGNVIPFINHLTLHRFRHILANMPMWKVVEMHLLPPAWRTGRWIPKLLRPLTRIPLLQEMFTARAVFVLQKTRG